MSAAAASALRLSSSWAGAGPLPSPIDRHAAGLPLPELRAEIDRAMAPCGRKAAAVLLDRLFSPFQMPPDGGERVYVDVCADLPAWALAHAVERIITTRKFSTAPQPAEILEAARTHPDWLGWARLRRFAAEAERVRRDITPPTTPEQKARVAAMIAGLGKPRRPEPMRKDAELAPSPPMTEADWSVRRVAVLAECEAAGIATGEGA